MACACQLRGQCLLTSEPKQAYSTQTEDFCTYELDSGIPPGLIWVSENYIWEMGSDKLRRFPRSLKYEMLKSFFKFLLDSKTGVFFY